METTNFNSTTNQKIKGEFVKCGIFACFSYEMDAILKASAEGAKDLPSYDDIENYFEDVCCKCGNSRPYSDANGGEFCQCGGAYESQPQEILEWWIVSDRLKQKLSEKGEAVLEQVNNCYWGRTTSGQAILLDHVISEICSEMEILEGQANEWKV